MVRQIKENFLFLLQVFLGTAFGLSQMYHMWTVSTEGILVTFFASSTAFAAFNWALTAAAYKEEKNKKTGQVLFIYIYWTLLCALCSGVQIFKGGFSFLNPIS